MVLLLGLWKHKNEVAKARFIKSVLHPVICDIQGWLIYVISRVHRSHNYVFVPSLVRVQKPTGNVPFFRVKRHIPGARLHRHFTMTKY